MFLASLVRRPLRLVGLLVLVGLIVTGVWLWHRAGESTPVSERRALDAYRAAAAASDSPRRSGVARPGVYVFRVTGSERGGVGPLTVGRGLPSEAPYVVTITPGGFQAELDLSDEHIEATRYRVGPRGLQEVWRRTDVTLLGVGRDDRRDVVPPALRVPLRPRVGQRWTAHYRAGDLPVAVAARVLRATSAEVDGRRLPAVLLRVRSVTGGAHPGTRTETVWWSPGLALPLRWAIDMRIHGTVKFTSRSTLVLTSTDPRT
jgi:hypothetical protein